MRVVILRIILLSLLLGGGHNFYTNKIDNLLTFNSPVEFLKNHQVTFSDKEHNSFIIEDNDIDIEEEHNSSQLKKHTNNSFHTSLTENKGWYLHHAHPSIISRLHKSLHFSSTHLGQTNPLYLILQVFRI